MATLNYEWQELGRVTFYSSGNDVVSIEGKLISQSTENNTSTISLRWVNVGAWWRTSNGTVAFTGTYTDSASCATYPDKINTGDVFYSIEKTISHSNDGSKTITVGGTISAYISGAQRSGTISQVSVVLPTIPRGSTWNSSLLTINNIESTFKFPITKYASSYYDKVEVRTTGNNTLVTTFNGVSSSTNYSFTSSQLNTIFSNTTSQYPIELTLILRTYTSSSGSQVGTDATIPCKAYIVNGEPTATNSVVEQDSKVSRFLGSTTSSKIIQNASDLKFTIVVTPKNSATVKSVTVNGKSATLSSGTTYTYSTTNITTGTFNIIVTDSRNLSKTYTITKTVISYVACKINSWAIARTEPTSSNVVLNANISCYTDKVNGQTLTKTVRYSKNGSSWTTIPSGSYTLSTNKITISNFTINGYEEYTKSAKFYLDVYDVITESKENKTISKGIPTFYYGSTDFGVNGNLYVFDSSGNNKIDITHQYSTSEIKVGYWINNKPIYRKVLSVSALPNATSMTVAHGISKLETITKLSGIAVSGTTTITLPFVGSSTSNGIRMYRTGNNITIACGSDRSGYSGHIIIEYTKTTD
jgi:hypothetical protein